VDCHSKIGWMVNMESLTRRKVMTSATTIAVVTVVAVIITKIIGAIVVAAFLAGAGTALVVVFLILAGLLTKSTNGKNEMVSRETKGE
jgi:hypothetical protein